MNSSSENDSTSSNAQGDTKGILYIVPTPIGNLQDITLRAIDTLKQVDLIAAEDTRHTGKLLQQFLITTPKFALHDHNEQEKAQVLIARLLKGESIALVSDAGTPLINDPGYHLVKQCRSAGIKVVPLPGACAAITALSAAGLPSDRFTYEGFLPAKSKARKDVLTDLLAETRTMIFYESPHRITDSIDDMLLVFGGERHVVLARELTKMWESIYGAPLAELSAWLREDDNRQRGEFVVIVEGAKVSKIEEEFSPEVLRTLNLLQGELSLKTAAALTAEIHNVKKNALYKWAIANQG